MTIHDSVNTIILLGNKNVTCYGEFNIFNQIIFQSTVYGIRLQILLLRALAYVLQRATT